MITTPVQHGLVLIVAALAAQILGHEDFALARFDGEEQVCLRVDVNRRTAATLAVESRLAFEELERIGVMGSEGATALVADLLGRLRNRPEA